MGNMKKTEVAVRSANPNCWTHGVPALNVKWWPYLPDITKKFKATTDKSKFICKVCGKSGRRQKHDYGRRDHRFVGGGDYTIHEFGDDAVFWRWVEGMENQGGASDYPNGVFTIAEEIAREFGWGHAKEYAYEVWGSDAVKVWSSGRSGGWLTVEGLGTVEDWDAIELSKWSRFAGLVKETVDDLDHQFVWHLHVNVWENWIDQFTRQPIKKGAA